VTLVAQKYATGREVLHSRLESSYDGDTSEGTLARFIQIQERRTASLGPEEFAQTLRLVRVLELRADKEESMSPKTIETAVQTIIQADLNHLKGLFFHSTIRIRPSDTRVIASLIERAHKLTNLVLPSLNTTIEGELMAAVSKVGLWLQYTELNLNLWFRPGADLQIASVFAQKGGTIHSLCLFGHDLESAHAMFALKRLDLSERKKAEPRRLLICDLAMPIAFLHTYPLRLSIR
jgi:hypothetical protein